MTKQTIQSQDMNVAEVFQAFYAVPDYQREYVWETEQVERLLDDINGELADADLTKAPEYFSSEKRGRESFLEQGTP